MNTKIQFSLLNSLHLETVSSSQMNILHKKYVRAITISVYRYLPKSGTLPIHKRLVLSFGGLEPLTFFRAQLVLHHESQECVVWCMSCSQCERTPSLRYINRSCDFWSINDTLKMRRWARNRKHTKHGVELHWDQVQAAEITCQVVLLGPGCVIEVRLSAKRVQHANHTPDWHTGGHTLKHINTHHSNHSKMRTFTFWDSSVILIHTFIHSCIDGGGCQN